MIVIPSFKNNLSRYDKKKLGKSREKSLSFEDDSIRHPNHVQIFFHSSPDAHSLKDSLQVSPGDF
jgi:hypothetical protein